MALDNMNSHFNLFPETGSVCAGDLRRRKMLLRCTLLLTVCLGLVFVIKVRDAVSPVGNFARNKREVSTKY